MCVHTGTGTSRTSIIPCSLDYLYDVRCTMYKSRVCTRIALLQYFMYIVPCTMYIGTMYDVLFCTRYIVQGTSYTSYIVQMYYVRCTSYTWTQLLALYYYYLYGIQSYNTGVCTCVHTYAVVHRNCDCDHTHCCASARALVQRLDVRLLVRTCVVN